MDPLPSNEVARKINREAVVLLGWGRALLLQLAHPLVAAAVADYSRFHHDADGYVRRVRRTVGAMLALTYGSPAEIRLIVDRINGVHAHVRGTLKENVGVFPAGTPYSARDPELLRWVHVTLIESIVTAYELFVEPLPGDERDQYCREAAWLARQLGVPESMLPLTYAEVQAQVLDARRSGHLVVGNDARMLAGKLLSPPLGPATLLFRVVRLTEIGLLPPDIRDAYGFAWDDQRERSFRRTAGMIRGARGMLPTILREWPAARTAARPAA